jgi:hypothetical protein
VRSTVYSAKRGLFIAFIQDDVRPSSIRPFTRDVGTDARKCDDEENKEDGYVKRTISPIRILAANAVWVGSVCFSDFLV